MKHSKSSINGCNINSRVKLNGKSSSVGEFTQIDDRFMKLSNFTNNFTYALPPITKLNFFNNDKKNQNFNVKLKQMDFKSILERNNENVGSQSNIFNKNSFRSISTNADLISNASIENLSQRNDRQLTIKNRNKRVIRNSKLFLKDKIFSPRTYEYTVDKFKVPEIAWADCKIKEKVAHAEMKRNKLQSGSEVIESLGNDEEYKEDNADSSDSEQNDKLSSSNFSRSRVEKQINEDDDFSNILDKHKDSVFQKILNEKSGIDSDINYYNYDKDIKIKTKAEVQRMRRELGDIRRSQFDNQNDFLNALHKKVQKEAFRKSMDYQNLKEVFTQYKQKKILDNQDCSISSKLYLINKNPLFEINTNVKFPHFISDADVLAGIYNINMYKLGNMSQKYTKIKENQVKFT
jgi:hypothetical protein